MLLDAVIGLVILVGLAVLTSKMMYQSHRELARLEDQRQAWTEAQQILTDMQMGRPGDWAGRIGRSVYIDPLLADAPGPGRLWVQVEVRSAGQTARLAGVVPTTFTRQLRDEER